MIDQFEFPFGNGSEFGDPVARASDPETSWEAAHDASFHSNRGRILVLRALKEHGPCTDYELEALTGWQKNSIGLRRLECQRAGLVMNLIVNGVIQKRISPSGSRCLVWRLTSKGENYFEMKQNL